MIQSLGLGSGLGLGSELVNEEHLRLVLGPQIRPYTACDVTKLRLYGTQTNI